MTAMTRRAARFVLPALVVLGMAVAVAAQRAAVDTRWHAWIGCWAPVGGPDPAGLAGSTRVCVIPGGTPQTVEMVTLVGAGIVSRERVDVSGGRRPTEEDGCKGWEQVEWSADGRRLYRRAEAECTGGIARSASQLMSMSPRGEWLDIMSAAIGPSTGVRVLRYSPVPATDVPADVSSGVEGRTIEFDRARTAAAAPVERDTLIDASQHASPVVVQAWLGETGKAFDVNGKGLVELSKAGVAPVVTDLLVALSYPDAFEVRPRGSSASSGRVSAFDSDEYLGMAYGSGRLMGCSRFGAGWGDCSYYDYSRFGGRYGIDPRYGSPYGTWYLGAEPVIVVVAPQGGSDQPHGQVVNGRGYVQGRDSSPQGSARSDSSSSSGSSSGSSGSSSGSGDSSSSSGGASAPSSGGGERTAHPR